MALPLQATPSLNTWIILPSLLPVCPSPRRTSRQHCHHQVHHQEHQGGLQTTTILSTAPKTKTVKILSTAATTFPSLQQCQAPLLFSVLPYSLLGLCHLRAGGPTPSPNFLMIGWHLRREPWTILGGSTWTWLVQRTTVCSTSPGSPKHCQWIRHKCGLCLSRCPSRRSEQVSDERSNKRRTTAACPYPS
jgi:hypothetical protein